MEVKLIKATNIRNEALELTGRKDSFDSTILHIRDSDWSTPNDIPETVAGARVIGQNRVIFNLQGNKYRMVCHYLFKKKFNKVILYLCWIGTHDDYDDLCNPSNDPTQYTVWKY